jgi:hypothetical protein
LRSLEQNSRESFNPQFSSWYGWPPSGRKLESASEKFILF